MPISLDPHRAEMEGLVVRALNFVLDAESTNKENEY